MGSQRVLPGKGVIFIKGLVFDTENRIQLKDFGEPLLDNLQRALDTPCADENYLTGIKMIQTGFEEYLKKMGVETFGKAGEPFDPNLHNAVMHIEDESLGKNVVAQVFQSGYRRGDRILRHAMVQQAN